MDIQDIINNIVKSEQQYSPHQDRDSARQPPTETPFYPIIIRGIPYAVSHSPIKPASLAACLESQQIQAINQGI